MNGGRNRYARAGTVIGHQGTDTPVVRPEIISWIQGISCNDYLAVAVWIRGIGSVSEKRYTGTSTV